MKNIYYCEGRKSPWRVTVRVNKREKKKYFKTETAAKAYLKEFNKIKERQGLEALTFDPAEKADYKFAIEEAKKLGFKTLSELILHIIGAKKNDESLIKTIPNVKTIEDALEEYIAEKTAIKRAESTIQDIRVRCGRFAKTFESFTKLTTKKIEQWSVEGASSPRTCRNNFVAVRTFLAWAKRRGYLNMELDFDRAAFLPRELKKQKPVFTLKKVNTILDYLQDTPTRHRFIPYYALQLFCGIRRAEVERMTWDLIDFQNESIRLPAEITKTGDEHIMRPPFLPNTVFAWLKPFAPTVNKKAAITVPSDFVRASIVKELGFKWENNGMRHTFATMHVSLHGDPAKTAVLLRHRNQQRLWQNYLARLIPEEDARQYFQLKPKNRLLMALGKSNQLV